MILREKIRVRATSRQVWAILADPSFRLSGPPRETTCEVMSCRPGESVTFRFSGDAFRAGGYVDETFRLRCSGDLTEIVHDVDFTHSGLPRPLQALMKVMDLVGRKCSKSSLDGVKELVEQSG